MKKPRDILFARHQSVAPKLDAIRQRVIQTRFPSGGEIRVSFVLRLWLELVVPCRRIWSGLAVAWVLLAVVNFSQRAATPPVMAQSSSSTSLPLTLVDQQKLLNELLADRALPADAEAPKSFVPKPRTEAVSFTTV